MNIQIFGKKKCFDTKKAERYFKERRVKFQSIDMIEKGISKGELESVAKAVGLKQLINTKAPDYTKLNLDKISTPSIIMSILLENPKVIMTPVVRNGKQATIGYAPDVWASWE